MSLRFVGCTATEHWSARVKHTSNDTNIGQSVRELVVNLPFIFYRPRFSIRFFISAEHFSPCPRWRVIIATSVRNDAAAAPDTCKTRRRVSSSFPLVTLYARADVVSPRPCLLLIVCLFLFFRSLTNYRRRWFFFFFFFSPLPDPATRAAV